MTTQHSLPEHLRGDGPCSRCGTADNPIWFTDNVFWNAVVRSAPLSWIDGEGDGFMCPTCFVRLADERGYYVTGWRIVPEFHWQTHTERAAHDGNGADPTTTEGRR